MIVFVSSESTALVSPLKFSSTWSVGSGQDVQCGLYQHASDECAEERKAKGLQTPPSQIPLKRPLIGT